MTVVGVNFIKIDAEKKGAVRGKIGVSNNVTMKDVKQTSLNIGDSKQKAMTFIFQFDSEFTPDIGRISLTGEIIYLVDGKKEKEIMDKWEKEKKVHKDVMEEILNAALAKSNIEAIIISKELNLPAPLPMPKVNVSEDNPKEKDKK